MEGTNSVLPMDIDVDFNGEDANSQGLHAQHLPGEPQEYFNDNVKEFQCAIDIFVVSLSSFVL